MRRTAAGRVHRPGPFVGARPFGERDRHLFFGRADVTQALVEAWNGCGLTVLHGDTGVGKSSLLGAGAVPALTGRGAHVLPVGRLCLDPAFPSAVLPEQNPYTRALLASWDPDAFPARGPGTCVTDFLRGHESTDRYGVPRPLFAALDQAELLLSPAAAEHHRRDTVDELLNALQDHVGLHLLLSVRTDHLDEVRGIIDKHGVEHAEIGLGPLLRDAAVEATARTLAHAGTRSAQARAEALVEEVRAVRDTSGRTRVRTDTVDPALLQTLGGLLYDPDHDRSPDEAGPADVDRLLTGYLARIVEEVAAEHLVPPGVPQAWLRRVAAMGGGVVVPRHGHRDTLLTRGLVHTLQDRHVVTANGDGSAYFLRHPRLARPLMALALHPYAESALEPWTTADRLLIARRAHTRGDAELAEEHARQALRADPPPGHGDRVQLTSLLGDLAFERGDHRDAARYYGRTAALLEAVGEATAVPRLIVAEARSRLLAGDRAAALGALDAAAGRVHGDSGVRTGIGQALWRAGQTESALDVLDGVLVGERAASEARRTRNRIRAEMTGPRPAPHRQGG